MHTFGNSCCQSCLAMIYMTNGTYIAMWFVTSEYFLLGIKSLADNSWKKQPTIQLMTTLLKQYSDIIYNQRKIRIYNITVYEIY